MKFSADQYLMISDLLVEKAAKRQEPESMGHLLTTANLLWHRAMRLRPPTSTMLTPGEIARLRREDEVGRQYFRMVGGGISRTP